MSAAPQPSPLMSTYAEHLVPPAPYDREIFTRAHEFLRKGGATNIADFANQIDCSRPLLSTYLHARSESPRNTEERLRGFFTRLDAKAITNDRFVATDVTNQVMEACREAFEDGEMAMIAGASGEGKTTGLLRYLEVERGRTGYVMVTASPNMSTRALVQLLAGELGVGRFGPTFEIEERVIAALKSQRQVLIVDDASHLVSFGRMKAWETLRRLHDLSGCGLVLVGITALMHRPLMAAGRMAEELAQFRRRVENNVSDVGFHADTRETQLAAVARAHAPWLTAAEAAVIAKRARNPGRIVPLVKRLRKLRDRNPGWELAKLLPWAEKQLFAA